VEANQDLDGTFRIEHLLHAANRGSAASKQLGGDQTMFSALVSASAVELGSAVLMPSLSSGGAPVSVA
jgi:hypothetical protein